MFPFSLPPQTSGFQIDSLKFAHKHEVNSMKLKFSLSQSELENEKNNLQGQTEGKNKLYFFFLLMRLNTGELLDLCASVPDGS